tara:strand:- start:61193 stop:61369 length:177 start_codon:yes stop_codon:yes gene_type:complete
MGILRFTDGVTLNTDGKLRVVRKKDGYYVLGEGMSIPVESREEGKEIIKQMNKDSAAH